ncbi:MAG: tetratricopeptide repeat protein [Desulfobacteraceae bacterium]|nr:tetratricopeptide repeat protein [Desulfobacteraceae bacterium]
MKLLKIHPQSVIIYNVLGAVLLGQNKLPEAVKAFNKAIQLKPDFAEAYNNRGNALKNLGQLEAALVSYNKAIEYKPNDAQVFSNRGNVLGQLGQPEAAVQSHKKAISIQPGYAEAYFNLGNALKVLGRFDEAFTALQTASQLKPGNAQIKENLINDLNCYLPETGTRGAYVKAQVDLTSVTPNMSEGCCIENVMVQQLYSQCQGVLNSHGINNKNYSATQIWRGAANQGHDCDQHLFVFETCNIIPEYCFSCYKVQAEPETVVGLFKLLLVFDSLDLPDDNSRKCMVEIRPGISGTYKGLIYCRKLAEAKEISSVLETIAGKKIPEKIPILVKRGCSEFQLAFSEYNQMGSNGQLTMTYNEAWRKQEKNAHKKYISPMNLKVGHTYNHSGFTLRDALIMNNWLDYAVANGDISYRKIIQSC